MISESAKRYRQSEKGRRARDKYNNSVAGKAAHQRHLAKHDFKLRKQRANERYRDRTKNTIALMVNSWTRATERAVRRIEKAYYDADRACKLLKLKRATRHWR